MCRCGMSAINLRQAIEIVADYCAALEPRGGQLRLIETSKSARITLNSLRTETTTTSLLVDVIGLFSFYQLFQWLIGVPIPVQQLLLGKVQREHTLPFLVLFGAPMLTTQEDFSFDFPSHFLDMPMVRRPNEFEEFFRVHPCGIFDRSQTPLGHQVESLLVASYQLGQPAPTQEDLAATFGLSLSTFRRKLENHNQDFLSIRNRAKLTVAKDKLANSQAPISEISSSLGFSDASAFRRYFKHMTSRTPSDWRLNVSAKGL